MISVILEKEIRQLFSFRGWLWLFAYSCLLSAFSLLLVSNTELSLLDHAEVMYMMMGSILAGGTLIAILQGSDSYGGERERRTLIPLLCSPVDSHLVFWAKGLGLLIAWAVMLLLAFPYLWAVSADFGTLAKAFGTLLIFGTPVVACFGFFSIGVSGRTGNVMLTLMVFITVLLAAASPLLLGPGLRSSFLGVMLDSVNPFAGALNSFDSLLIDNDPLSAQSLRLIMIAIWTAGAMLIARRMTQTPNID